PESSLSGAQGTKISRSNPFARCRPRSVPERPQSQENDQMPLRLSQSLRSICGRRCSLRGIWEPAFAKASFAIELTSLLLLLAAQRRIVAFLTTGAIVQAQWSISCGIRLKSSSTRLNALRPHGGPVGPAGQRPRRQLEQRWVLRRFLLVQVDPQPRLVVGVNVPAAQFRTARKDLLQRTIKWYKLRNAQDVAAYVEMDVGRTCPQRAGIAACRRVSP